MGGVQLLANANRGLNIRRSEALKPELDVSYRYVCAPSNAITTELFGDELPKAVKDITDTNRITSKIHRERKDKFDSNGPEIAMTDSKRRTRTTKEGTGKETRPKEPKLTTNQSTELPSEVGKGTRTYTNNSTSLANTGLVVKITESPDSHPFNTSTSEGPAYSSSCGGSTFPKEPASDDGLSLVREHYRTKRISGTAVSLFMQSWRAGTKRKYSCYLKKWAAFCTKREFNSFQPSITEVLDFPSELYSQGFTYCAINNARSALTLYITVNDGQSVGQHPLVQRLISPDHQSQNTRRYGIFKLFGLPSPS
ncbi:uncharacterized protein [Montipora foliosa]|uniref:uncharacterized protein n=1 Tax=Montipora foliosa TaxID=591990 RepID=UPI0035F1861F